MKHTRDGINKHESGLGRKADMDVCKKVIKQSGEVRTQVGGTAWEANELRKGGGEGRGMMTSEQAGRQPARQTDRQAGKVV